MRLNLPRTHTLDKRVRVCHTRTGSTKRVHVCHGCNVEIGTGTKICHFQSAYTCLTMRARSELWSLERKKQVQSRCFQKHPLRLQNLNTAPRTATTKTTTTMTWQGCRNRERRSWSDIASLLPADAESVTFPTTCSNYSCHTQHSYHAQHNSFTSVGDVVSEDPAQETPYTYPPAAAVAQHAAAAAE